MKKIFVLMGGPGCGKGTVAGPLCASHNLECFEMGATFRALPVDSPIMQNIRAGNLVPDDMVFELVTEKLNDGQNLLLDGFPRTLPQAEWLIKNYADNNIITVIYINIDGDVMRQRIKKRHGMGSGRADDADDSIIENRIGNFKKQTMPAIEWLADNPAVRFIDIDGTPAIDTVVNQILGAL